jgi:PII-like signaling protein
MLAAGPAKKVTIYVNEDATAPHHQPLHQAVLEFLLKSGVSGATAMRAMAGFGRHHRMHTARIELLAEHLPILVEFVESPEKVQELLPALAEMVADGMIEVQDTTVIKVGSGR